MVPWGTVKSKLQVYELPKFCSFGNFNLMRIYTLDQFGTKLN